MRAGKLQHNIQEHCLPITSLEFHPSEELLASTSADRTACFWNVQDGQLIAKTAPDTSGDHHTHPPMLINPVIDLLQIVR